MRKQNKYSNLQIVKISYFQLAATQNTAHKMKFSIKDFFSKYDQIRWKLRVWSHLLKKSIIEKFIFCTALTSEFSLF